MYKVRISKYGVRMDVNVDFGSKQAASDYAKELNKSNPTAKARAVQVKPPKAPKYKTGDMVYSYQNKTVAGRVNYIRKSTDATYPHAYRLTLPDGSSSKWINEDSISKRRIK